MEMGFLGFLYGLSLFLVSQESKKVPKKLNIYTDAHKACYGFYSLPSEIQEHITSLFISHISSELKYQNFQKTLLNNGIFRSDYCKQLDREENKIAYDEDHPNDRYVQSLFYTERSTQYFKQNHYHLCLKRSRLGILKMLDCKQSEVSLVTFKNNVIKVYYKRDDEGYDLQLWLLSINQIKDKLDCLPFALAYKDFDSSKKDFIPIHLLCRKNITYDSVESNK